MVFVKVRETYDLHTTKNKMTVIGIHTPKSDIIKRNYPGLLMQCRAYRPVSCDVRVACASVMPLDPQGVGTSVGDVAPEDVFNPILYKAMSNKGMSQLEARINYMNGQAAVDVSGETAQIDVDSVTPDADDFNTYYGLLANTHDWKHASPQSGLSMTGLKPFVYEIVYNLGDSRTQLSAGNPIGPYAPNDAGNAPAPLYAKGILGKAKEMPFINCTSYTCNLSTNPETGYLPPGFDPGAPNYIANAELDVPYLTVMCAAIIVPPSKLHELFYRMVVEWTIEFTGIRPLAEITDWAGLARLGAATHYQNYSYTSAKEAITGDPDSIMDSDSCMVSANVDVEKVM